MIISDHTHIHDQLRSTPHFEKGLAFLQRPDLAMLADGSLPIDGENVFAEVQSYVTKPASEARFEAHRTYIDIQYVVSGEETIAWAPIEMLHVDAAYIPERDFMLGTVAAGHIVLVPLRTGQFAIMFPSDAHAPRLSTNDAVAVKKIVVKIRAS